MTIVMAESAKSQQWMKKSGFELTCRMGKTVFPTPHPT